ncbi:MAG TPA: hypothetical protein VGP93_18575 [Polyangiaceae bacterium]|nr:hypothetical protein [Polyangiaceae bacterium]
MKIFQSLLFALTTLSLACGSGSDNACERGGCSAAASGGAGGSGSGGGPPLESPCTLVTKADGSAPLIDDFEDGDDWVGLNEGRTGFWFVYDDGTGVTAPSPDLLPLPTADGSRPGSSYAFEFTGSGHKDYGGGVDFTFLLDLDACYDARGYAGLSFWAKGTVTILVEITTFETFPTDDGGGCSDYQDCAPHTALIELGPDWAPYTVNWSDLYQPFGREFPFDYHSLKYVGFRPVAATSWDFWLDDIAFVPKQ